MKRKFLIEICLFIFILTGCELNNNPTSKVEELLGKYQGLDKEITYNYEDLSNETNLDQNLINEYEELIKKQYRNMSYEIKDEKTDGDVGTITVEIEVLDYKSVIEQYSEGNSDTTSTQKEIIKKLKQVKDKTTYTIDFTVTKDKKGNWEIDNLDMTQRQKLLGVY